MAQYEQPIEQPINKIRADQREHHWPYMSNALQVAAQRPIQEQWQRAQAQRCEKGARQPAHFRVDAQRVENRRQKRKRIINGAVKKTAKYRAWESEWWQSPRSPRRMPGKRGYPGQAAGPSQKCKRIKSAVADPDGSDRGRT